jgi:hypothetical protein
METHIDLVVEISNGGDPEDIKKIRRFTEIVSRKREELASMTAVVCCPLSICVNSDIPLNLVKSKQSPQDKTITEPDTVMPQSGPRV